MRIRFYGRLGDAFGREAEVDAPEGSTVAQIRKLLSDTHPTAAEALSRSRACVGERLIDDESRVSSHDVVEFLPPVSGG